MGNYFDKIYFLHHYSWWVTDLNVYDMKLEHLLILRIWILLEQVQDGIKFPSRANTGMKSMTLTFPSLQHFLYKSLTQWILLYPVFSEIVLFVLIQDNLHGMTLPADTCRIIISASLILSFNLSQSFLTTWYC